MPANLDALHRAVAIAYVAVADLKPYAGNARAHPKRQIAELIKAFRQFGVINPIIIDEHRAIIAGHGRWMAARDLGLDTVPTITVSGLSEAQKRALRLADNKLGLMSAWTPDQLEIELRTLETELAIDGLEFEIPGFSIGEIDVALSPKRPNDNLDDELAPVRAEPRTKPGDIYVLGPHRIGCGSVLDPSMMSRLMGGAQADAAFQDFPYNVSISGHANVRSKHREFAMASGEMSPAEFTTFLKGAAEASIAASREGAVHFLCMDWRHINELTEAANSVYGALLNLCVWNKNNAGMGSLYRSKHELVFVYRVGKASHMNNVELGRHGRNRTNVWDYPSVNTAGARAGELELHPTVKPVAMVADAFQDVTKRGDVVLDTFLGSGTTLIAAERTGRVCRGLDIDPTYVDVAVDRWVAMTGGEPQLERADGWGGHAPREAVHG